MKEREIVMITRAHGIVSILEDTFTFSGFIVVLWFNHAYLSGNGWLDAMFVLLWISTVASMQSRRVKRFTSTSEAIAFLEGGVAEPKQ
ncbi:hypothetical protein B5P43_18290 [Bacillus sp. SRB_336]|nr:hypothetical protein B5P43_18290 [Bacillus sp. SRB_336]